jgi:hypothetical protein
MRRLLGFWLMGLWACGGGLELHDGGLPYDAGVADAGVEPDGGVCPVDACPVSAGLTWACQTRFAYGANYAWHHFGADFGGVAAWGQGGVAAESVAVSADLARMKASGVSVVRWWLFPRFFTDGIAWSADGVPTGLAATTEADLTRALELAEANDVYVIFTLFSFDNLLPTKVESGITTRGLQPLIIDDTRRAALLEHLVKPVAQVVAQSPHASRMLGWDIINEPEWAMTGPDSYGGEAFSADATYQAVTHPQMETFVRETAQVLHANSRALVTVGSAAIKWAPAWQHAGLDFYQLHYYDWIYQWYPYQQVTLAAVGLNDKPTVMGEFPMAGLSAMGASPARTPQQLSEDLYAAGYAGAQVWAFDETTPYVDAAVKAFHDEQVCRSTYAP